jgi:hypothetical protein
MDSQIAKIRAACTIAWAWRILNLPGTPARNCKSPFRTETRASFSIYQAKDGERWFDHSLGIGGDVVDFVAQAKGVGIAQALRTLQAMTGTEAPQSPPDAFLEPQRVETADNTIQWPENLCAPTPEECRQLSALRSLSPEAFFLAAALGTLLVGTQRGQRLWITTDARMRSAARRRLDGQPLEGIGKKSASPKGAPRDWIIGTQTFNPQLDQLKNILLVEGEGDYYAGLELALESSINFKVLAILGAAAKTFHKDCQPQFADARVIVIPHNDRSLACEKDAIRWSGQIHAFGATGCFIQRLPIVCNDLNDFRTQRPNQGHELLKGFT